LAAEDDCAVARAPKCSDVAWLPDAQYAWLRTGWPRKVSIAYKRLDLDVFW
jgi:hypothetical protein